MENKYNNLGAAAHCVCSARYTSSYCAGAYYISNDIIGCICDRRAHRFPPIIQVWPNYFWKYILKMWNWIKKNFLELIRSLNDASSWILHGFSLHMLRLRDCEPRSGSFGVESPKFFYYLETNTSTINIWRDAGHWINVKSKWGLTIAKSSNVLAYEPSRAR